MKKDHPILLLGGFILLISNLFALDVVASVDANTITLNDVFTFKINANDSDENPRVDISPLLDNFSIISGPAQQTNLQWVNGKMTSSRSLTWTLVPNRVGTLVIPALAVKIGRKTMMTRPIQIKVTKTKNVQSTGDLFLVAEVDKVQAFIGEQITITYKLYTKVNLSISDVRFPDHVGFWTEELYTPKQVDFREVQLQGVRYKVATLYKIALFPTKQGDLTLTPMVVKCNVDIKSKRRRRSIWDDPFFNSIDPFSRQTVLKILKTEETVITVNPFPEGQPPDFTNAVGNFKLATSLDTNTVRINEAVTYRVSITGTGNISLFSIPELIFPLDLEVFPPTTTIEKEPFRDAITGTITWEYILIPRQTGKYTLPRIELAYFNPEDKDWHRTGSIPLQLSVIPGKEYIVSTSGHTKEEIKLLGSDIRYIRTQTPHWIRNKGQAVTIGAVLLYSLAILLYFSPGFLSKAEASRIANADIRQSKKALSTALKKLKKTSADPFGQAAVTIYRYLKEKFYLPSDNLDPLTVKNTLSEMIKAEELDELVTLLKTCDAGRFAPGAEEIKDTLISQVRNLLKRIDSHAN